MKKFLVRISVFLAAVAFHTVSLPASASASESSTINFANGFNSSQGEITLNGSAQLSGSVLQLTNLNGNQVGSVWYADPVNVQSFTTNFTFLSSGPSADGFTFTIQGHNAAALGSAGEEPGYGLIPNSVAVKFDSYNNSGEGSDSISIYTDGSTSKVPATAMTSSGVNLHSGHAMAVQMVYSGTTLTMTISDTVTNASFTTSRAINIPATVGAKAAYVGFTGGTNILTWTYSPAAVLPPPTFSVASGAYSSPQTVALSDVVAGATIYYTTNGTTPTTSSTKYTGPIPVSATEAFAAIAVASGYINSPAALTLYAIDSSAPTGGLSPAINFSKGFASSRGQVALNGSAQLRGSALQLTNLNANEAGSVWYPDPISVQSFTTNFTFQSTSPSAGGLTFAIQGNNTAALGGPGEELGYGQTPASVAVKFDLYNNSGEGPNSTGLYTNGDVPTVPAIDMTSSGVNLHSGHMMAVQMVYNGTMLTMTITDIVTKASFSTSWSIDIPAIVDANTAYVGFTGGTGNSAAVQDILTWTYHATALPSLPKQGGRANGAVASAMNTINNATSSGSVVALPVSRSIQRSKAPARARTGLSVSPAS